MAGVFFVDRVIEKEPVMVEHAAEDIEDARDLEMVRTVLMEILPRYPEVFVAVQEEVQRRNGPGTSVP